MNTSGFDSTGTSKGCLPPRMTHARRVVPQRRNTTSGTSLTQRIPFSAGNASSSLEAPVEIGVTECDTEATLAGSIQRLWLMDRDKKSSLRRSRQEMAENRVALAKHLSELKNLLAGRGRDGAWLPFLRRIGIPRSTAEGLIKSHLTGGKKDNTPRLASAALTKESIGKLLKALRPKLIPVNTRELADEFVRELVVMLDEQVALRIELESSPGEDRRQSPPEPAQMRGYEQFIPVEAV